MDECSSSLEFIKKKKKYFGYQLLMRSQRSFLNEKVVSKAKLNEGLLHHPGAKLVSFKHLDPGRKLPRQRSARLAH